MNTKIRLLIAFIGIALMFGFAFIFKSCQQEEPQLVQTDVGLMCNGAKITYYVDQNGTEYVQFDNGEIQPITE